MKLLLRRWFAPRRFHIESIDNSMSYFVSCRIKDGDGAIVGNVYGSNIMEASVRAMVCCEALEALEAS